MYRRFRDLAMTGITIVAAIAFTTLGATGASATTAAPSANAAPDSTGYLCGDELGTPYICLQIIGSGDTIDTMHAWADEPGPPAPFALGWSAHIQLYYMTPAAFDESQLRGIVQGEPFTAPWSAIPIGNGGNCQEFTIDYGNSSVCPWDPNHLEATGYYCAAVWYDYYNELPADWVNPSWRCAYVHP